MYKCRDYILLYGFTMAYLKFLAPLTRQLVIYNNQTDIILS